MFRKIILFTTLIVILLCSKANANDISETKIKDTIVQHSVEMGIDPAIALAIAKIESNYHHTSRSKYGAVGVFQLMPSTAARLGVNPYHLSDNVKGGIMYYKMMYKMFGTTELALAAYNAGPAYILKNHCAPTYTRNYVSKIMAEYNKLKSSPQNLINANTYSDKYLPHLGINPTHSLKPMSSSEPILINDGVNRLIISKIEES